MKLKKSKYKKILKLKKNLRFEIVKKLIKKKTSLIDVCGGCGWLKDHLDQSIKYTVDDASEEFGKICKKKIC